MNHSNNDIIERNGRIYHYDADSDIYYAYQEESTVSRWAWVVVIGVLALGCLAAEYRDPGLVTVISTWVNSFF